MARNETAKATIYLDGKQAEAAIDALKQKSKELKLQLDAAKKAGDTITMKKLENEIRGVDAASRSLLKDSFDVEKVLKNINKVSWRDLEKAQKAVVSEMKRMERGTEAYAAKEKNLAKITDELNRTRGVMRQNESLWSRMGDGFNKYFGMATAAVASLTGIAFGFKKASQAANDFEERVDNLSSLTGLAGDELQWLEQRAKDLSTSVLDGGVRVKQGAQEIVDAFTKTGSARPELLQNKEALSGVTEESIILANAAKTELQPAIESLTMMLNQFNAPASDSRRIINALAAGSKAGAGEIPYLTQAVEKSGTVAADAGLSYETLIATIETLAPRISQPEIAGRTLKGVLLDLQTGADDTNPAIVGMTTAIENLGKKNLSVTELTKMFGTENVTTAKILINNVGELKKYEAAVTGTNVAIEQATINTGNNNAKLAQARNELNLVTLDLGKKLAPAMVVSTNGFTWFVKVAAASLDFISKHGKALIIAGSAIAGYTIAVKTAAAWDTIHYGYLVTKGAIIGVLNGQITAATIRQRAWNLALKANPIGLIIGIIAGGIAWLISWNKETGKVTEAFKKMGPVFADIKKWFTDLYNESFLVRAGFHYFFAMLSTGFTAVTVVLRSFWEQLKLGGKLLKAVLTFDLKGIKEAFADYSSNMKTVVTDSAKKVGETWATGFNSALKGKIKPVEVPVYGPLQAKQNTGFTFSGIGDMIQAQNQYVRPGTPSPKKTTTPPVKRVKTVEEIQEAFKTEQTTLDSNGTKAQTDIKKQLLEKLITEEQANEALLAVEIEFLEKKKALQIKYGQDYLDTEAAIIDKKLQAAKDADKKSEEEKKTAHDKILKDLDNKEAEELNVIKKQLADKQITEEEAQQDILVKEIEFLNQRIALKIQWGEDTADLEGKVLDKTNQIAENALKTDEARAKQLYDLRKDYEDEEVARAQEKAAALAELDALQKAGMLSSEEEYQRLKTKIVEKYEGSRFEKTQAYLGAVNNILSGAADFFSSMKDAELAKAGDNAAKREKIEKEYAKKQKAIAIGQAIIAGAMAVMQLWAEKSVIPFPVSAILKGVMTGVIAGTTIAQIAKIKNAEFYDGGHTGPGSKYEPKGVVHAEEYVIPEEGTKNPMIKPVIDVMEIARRNGSLARLDLRHIVQTVPARGFAVGGFTSNLPKTNVQISEQKPEFGDTSPQQVISTGLDTATANRLIAAIEKFEKKKLVVYTELIKKDLETLANIDKKREL
jgi:TP901 family phage tail tape measure protein